MKAIRHQITCAKREAAALLLMLAVSAAALAVGFATVQSSSRTESSLAHPCRGLSSITMIVSAPTLAAGNDLTRQTTAPSGDCALTVTLRAGEHTFTEPQLGLSETCAVTMTPSLQGGGAVAEVQRTGVCGTLSVETRIDISPKSAPPSWPIRASNHPAKARSGVSVRGLPPFGAWVQSYVRGVWDYDAHGVILRDLKYPNDILTKTKHISIESRRSWKTYGDLNDFHITVSNRIRWSYWIGVRFSTIATLTMRPNGAYSCRHWFSGFSRGDAFDVEPMISAECLP